MFKSIKTLYITVVVLFAVSTALGIGLFFLYQSSQDLNTQVVKIEQTLHINKTITHVQKGLKGKSGQNGIRGFNGRNGHGGVRGAQGLHGTAGSQGSQGPQGLQGVRGSSGSQGQRGPEGPRGPQGPRGARGPAGPPGITRTITKTVTIKVPCVKHVTC